MTRDALDQAAGRQDVTPKWKRGAFIAADGVAMGGYDPVAYFTEREAVQGNPGFEATWSACGRSCLVEVM